MKNLKIDLSLVHYYPDGTTVQDSESYIGFQKQETEGVLLTLNHKNAEVEIGLSKDEVKKMIKYLVKAL